MGHRGQMGRWADGKLAECSDLGRWVGGGGKQPGGTLDGSAKDKQ